MAAPLVGLDRARSRAASTSSRTSSSDRCRRRAPACRSWSAAGATPRSGGRRCWATVSMPARCRRRCSPNGWPTARAGARGCRAPAHSRDGTRERPVRRTPPASGYAIAGSPDEMLAELRAYEDLGVERDGVSRSARPTPSARGTRSSGSTARSCRRCVEAPDASRLTEMTADRRVAHPAVLTAPRRRALTGVWCCRRTRDLVPGRRARRAVRLVAGRDGPRRATLLDGRFLEPVRDVAGRRARRVPLLAGVPGADRTAARAAVAGSSWRRGPRSSSGRPSISSARCCWDRRCSSRCRRSSAATSRCCSPPRSWPGSASRAPGRSRS